MGKTEGQRKNSQTEGLEVTEKVKGKLGRDWRKQNISAWERLP